MNEMTQEQQFGREVYLALEGIFADYQEWDWEVMDMCAADGTEPSPEHFLQTSIVEAVFAVLGENSDVHEYFMLLVRQIAEERITQIKADNARVAAA